MERLWRHENEEHGPAGKSPNRPVVGNKTKSDAVLLTLAERQTRFEVILKLPEKDAESVDQAVQHGSEFTGLHDALQDVADVYFSHPNASWERGTSENQHKLIRRFIPKGSPIGNVSENQIFRIQRWMNDYPQKILGYATPHDTFVQAFRQERLAV